jgi:putative MFS transporter
MLVMDRFERKWLLGGSLVVMAALGLAYGNAVTPVWIVLWGFTFTVIANLMSNVTHVYQLEQYPTAIRTTATGRLYSLGRLSTAAAPLYLIPMLEHSGAGAVFTLVAAALAVAAVVTVGFGVATTGRTLEEISPGDASAAVIPQRARTAP